jgi:dipeptidyl aminopeptidase/acylaminoacyl peptidase
MVRPGFSSHTFPALRRLLPAVLLLAILPYASAQTRRPISPKDFDQWRIIAGQGLSRDGRFLAYGLMPQDGDGDVVVRELATGREWRHPVGALPPPPIQPTDQTIESPPAPRTLRMSFTSDGKWLVVSTFASKVETEKARKEKKKPEEMPKPGMLIISLADGSAQKIEAVKSMQVPEKGGAWVAYHKEARPERPAEGAKPAESAKPGDEDQTGQARRGGSVASGAGAAGRKEYGTDLVLRDLSKSENNERTYANVSDYSFARDGRTLVYTVSARNEEENGIFAVTPSTDAAPAALLAGKGKYSRITWDREQTQLAFLSDKEDAASKPPKLKVYLWDRKAPQAESVIAADTPGFPQGMVVSDRGNFGFSRDGKRMMAAYAKPGKPEPDPKETAATATEEKVLMDLWHYKDDYVQPMQKAQANAERNRSYAGVFHIADRRYVPVATPQMPQASFSDDALKAMGTDDRAYRTRVDYDGRYSDVYLVDTSTGQRNQVLRALRGGGFMGGGFQLSPDGLWAMYYNDRHWHLFSVAEGTSRNMTARLGVAFHDEDDDHPEPPNSYRSAGWARDSKSYLVYDKFDVWQVFVDGRAARNVTAGAGRREKIEFRVQSIEPVEPEDARGIDVSRPLTLIAEHQTTRESGFYRVDPNGTAAPQRLLWGPKRYRYVGRAKEADVLLITASRFDEYPDLQTTDSTFAAPRKVSSGGDQLKQFVWGTSELISYRNADGKPLQAALYKPAGFDPKKKYPMLVYYYEIMSNGVHGFQDPRPGHNPNFSLYASNGYVVLNPDIIYEIGHPGQSALKCVTAAVDAVVAMGFVDEKRIGLAGHSWGGYQTAYIITQTSRFAAAEAGAPVGNMTSAYSGIRWGSGMPRQFQYEKAQSRIGKSLYEAPHLYLENSPIFHIQRATTPLLILHDDQDDAVPWYQGIELFLAMRRHGKEAYLLNYNGEFHGLRRRHNQKDYTWRMMQFFDHHLKGAPAPEWMKKGVPYIDREDEKERFKQATDGK